MNPTSSGHVGIGVVDREVLLSLEPAQRLGTISDYLCDRYAAITDRERPSDPDEQLFLESLHATEFQLTVESELGVSVSLADLVEAPSPRALAEAIDLRLTSPDEALVEGADGPALVPDPGGLHEPFGLTDVQHAYWLGRSGLFELGDVSTHLYLELESEDFEPERGNTVLRRLVARHDMLRAIVRPDGRQQILDTVPEASIAYQDLSQLSDEEAEAEITAVRDTLSHEVRPADQWPLFELRAQRLPGGTTRLHLSLDMLIADAASVRILLTEWAALYADPDTVLPPIGLSFRDYCTATTGLENTTARNYWTQRLHTLPPAPELPTLPIPPGTPTRFTRRTHTLPADQWARLKNQAHQRGLTPSALLCAAYAETLATWAKEPHFTLNVTIGDRLPLHPDTEHLIGDFTNLILLETDHRTEGSYTERAGMLQRQLWRDLEHRAFGGVRLIRELAREHGPARAAMPVVFTSVLGYEMPGSPGRPVRGLGHAVGALSQTPQVHLDCQVVEQDEALVVSWDAVEKLFPAGVLDDAFSAYTALLGALAETPDTWDLTHPVSAPAAHLRVVEAVNSVVAPVPEGLLHEPVFAQAARTPHATAVITPTRTLTYAELTDHALHIAQGLRAHGVRPGELVAISMHKGWEQIAAVLGILHADAVYLPIDPELPHERITYLLTHTDTRTVLTQPDTTTSIDWPTTITPLTVHDNAPWYHTPTPHTPTRTPNDLAYVIFTSGSTGQPKGVMIDHRGALNTIHDINNRTQLTPHDTILGISSLSFDLSVWDIFGTLTAGATLVLPNPGTQRDPHHWNHLITHHHITTWNSVPALFELLTEHRNQNNTPTNTTLKTALLSGDWIPLTLPQRAKNTFPHLQLHSLGGATEASIWSIHHPITTTPEEWTSIPYGKPLTNQTMHILDHHQNPRPPYTTGHIHIGGTGVALGYWKDPQKPATPSPPTPTPNNASTKQATSDATGPTEPSNSSAAKTTKSKSTATA
ncbi:AMP-binding protein [Streptomyces sp. NBC_00250]|uniref:AMP-binding protein n=1 Tax=Streptomyces sp. NBC_00250 TaxID=2903641 RepID=UPI002E27F119|nr:AMP-binding protein [Streptomyces sp. NBC_00250]